MPAGVALHAPSVAEKEDNKGTGDSGHSRLRSLWLPIALSLLCLVVYNANLRQIGAGDTLPARYLPLGMWRYGTVELDPIARWIAHGHSMIAPWYRPAITNDQVYFEPWAYWMIETDHHHLVSVYPVVAPLLVAPLYLPAVAYLAKQRWEQPAVDRVADAMEKFCASLLAAIASVLMYLVLRRDAARWSLPLALAFAFGTNTWMISSQALWQHGTGELLICLALLLSISAASPARSALLGAICVAIAANRPPDALIAGAFLLCAVCTRWRSGPWLLAGAALPLSAVLLYNIGVIGSLAGGYGIIKTPTAQFFGDSFWSGMAGLLVSPGRGLLVFSPFLIFVPIGLMCRLRTSETRILVCALAVAVVAQLVLYSLADWRAGTSWGPRWLTDSLPVLMWMLSPAPLGLRLVGRSLLILTILISVAVQAIGAFWYDKSSDEAILTNQSTSNSGAWTVSNVPFLAELRHPRAQPEIQCGTKGSIDRVGLTVNPVPGSAPPVLGPGALLEGWALACGRTPAQLLVLIDGIVIGSTQDFVPRPDVDLAMRTNALSGWRVFANMQGVEPGERMLQLAVRIQPRSDIRIVREQRVIAVGPNLSSANATNGELRASPSGLAAAAARAASLLRSRQSGDGYWLTSYTTEPRFENSQSEMNIFVTSMLVDLLSPIAHENDLSDLVQRAREHLRAQIETDGLVRYHGLPGGKTIGPLGCVITPDADDTALAWRIARPEPNDQRRQRMLEMLARYRDARGLYHTWLAPRDRYECLDTGRDPNPTDATIQMHVYLMLRELDPPAAVDLCRTLQGAIGDNNLWVYYANAPLIPFLRCAELRQQGCDLPLPTDRLSHPGAGQEIWSEAIRALAGLMSASPSVTDRQAILDLLARISRNEFAVLHRMPPLIYHNDLTATVPRYYWSEDFGCALWLRLYKAACAKPNSSANTQP